MAGSRTDRRRGWLTIAGAALALAAGTLALEWLDWLRLVRGTPSAVGPAMIAAGFLALGVVAGVRLAAARRHPPADTTALRQSLGISAREQMVLERLAAGRTNKEIALDLGISPETVKSHVGRVFASLKVGRRTEAIARARALGLLP